MTSPLRRPDATSINAALAGLEPATADADLLSARAHAFPGFQFSVARIDDDYWRDTRSVIRPDGTRIGELRAELAKDDGDVDALWRRLKETDLQITDGAPPAASCSRRPVPRRPITSRSRSAARASGRSPRSSIPIIDASAKRSCPIRAEIDAIDRELGLPLGWVFLMSHGHWVEAEIGQAIATGLREQRVRLPDNAGVQLRWVDEPDGF